MYTQNDQSVVSDFNAELFIKSILAHPQKEALFWQKFHKNEFTFEQESEMLVCLNNMLLKDDENKLLISSFIGAIYAFTEHPHKDAKLGARYILRASLMKTNSALINLARLHLEGIGIEQNYLMAKQQLKSVAKRGDAAALYYLGVMQQEGMGVSINLSKAARLFRKAYISPQVDIVFKERSKSKLIALKKAHVDYYEIQYHCLMALEPNSLPTLLKQYPILISDCVVNDNILEEDEQWSLLEPNLDNIIHFVEPAKDKKVIDFISLYFDRQIKGYWLQKPLMDYNELCSQPKIKQDANALFQLGAMCQNGWGVKKDLVQAAVYFRQSYGLSNIKALLKLKSILSQRPDDVEIQYHHLMATAPNEIKNFFDKNQFQIGECIVEDTHLTEVEKNQLVLDTLFDNKLRSLESYALTTNTPSYVTGFLDKAMTTRALERGLANFSEQSEDEINNNSQAQYQLGVIYQYGIDATPIDLAKAVLYFRKAYALDIENNGANFKLRVLKKCYPNSMFIQYHCSMALDPSTLATFCKKYPYFAGIYILNDKFLTDDEKYSLCVAFEKELNSEYGLNAYDEIQRFKTQVETGESADIAAQKDDDFELFLQFYLSDEPKEQKLYSQIKNLNVNKNNTNGSNQVDGLVESAYMFRVAYAHSDQESLASLKKLHETYPANLEVFYHYLMAKSPEKIAKLYRISPRHIGDYLINDKQLTTEQKYQVFLTHLFQNDLNLLADFILTSDISLAIVNLIVKQMTLNELAKCVIEEQENEENALYVKGLKYLIGQGVSIDPVLAAINFRQAHALSHKDTKFNLQFLIKFYKELPAVLYHCVMALEPQSLKTYFLKNPGFIGRSVFDDTLLHDNDRYLKLKELKASLKESDDSTAIQELIKKTNKIMDENKFVKNAKSNVKKTVDNSKNPHQFFAYSNDEIYVKSEQYGSLWDFKEVNDPESKQDSKGVQQVDENQIQFSNFTCNFKSKDDGQLVLYISSEDGDNQDFTVSEGTKQAIFKCSTLFGLATVVKGLTNGAELAFMMNQYAQMEEAENECKVKAI